ncbi:MAG: lytic transglycosylase domain-containing protein [Pseudobdellovibrionaceae bacterium]
MRQIKLMQKQIQWIMLLLLLSASVFAAENHKISTPMEINDLNKFRLSHAKELLGTSYKHSTVKSAESFNSIYEQVYTTTHRYLPKTFKHQYKKIAQVIIDSSIKNELDPVFVMAIIMSESSFDPKKVGSVGEIGLMQIRPETAAWLAKKFKLPWKGAKTLRDPVANIRIGTTYLAHLRKRFDSHAQLYIAAYNMGQGNVQRKLAEDVWPKIYPRKVMENYVAFYKDFVTAHNKDLIAQNN